MINNVTNFSYNYNMIDFSHIHQILRMRYEPSPSTTIWQIFNHPTISSCGDKYCNCININMTYFWILNIKML
jgi:hypothetical protein